MATDVHMSEQTAGTGRALHTRTQVLGLLLIAGAIGLTTIAGLVTGLPLSDASFLIPMFLGAAGGALLAWRFGTWGRAVGLLLGFAAGFMTFWLMFGIFTPASFVEFTSGVAFVIGVVLMLFGAIVSLKNRNDLRTEPTDREQQIGRIALIVVAAALVVSLPMWLLARESVDAAAAQGLPEVTASNFHYDDTSASAADGQVSLVVRNSDAFAHTFTIDALDVDVHLLPGSSQIVTFPASAGTYTFYCIPHSAEQGASEDDMAAELTVD